MARESKVTKERVCRHCERTFLMTAKEIKGHAALCQRATAVGLVLPTVSLK